MNLLLPCRNVGQPISLLIFVILFSSCRHPSTGHSAITVNDLSGSANELRIDDWKISRADTGAVRTASIYHAKNDYVDLSDTFPSDQRGSYYAECIINSIQDQDAALLMGASGTLSAWVNDSMYLENASSRTERNENILPVHLTKGKNKILLRVGDVTNKKTFYCSISSIAYASRLYLLYNASNFLKECLLARRDSLTISIDRRLIPRNDSLRVVLTGPGENIIWKGSLNSNDLQPIPLSMLPRTGAYSCRMQAGDAKFEQTFIYGDHRQLFGKMSADLRSYCKADGDRINTETLLQRYQHLDSAWKKDGPGNLLNRKIALTLADLQSSLLRFTGKQEGFAHLPGLHLRGFRSEIDGGIDNYMLYVPSSYRRGEPIPLVVIMPFITNKLSFIKSWRVADINGIDMVRHLADQYGFALLSPSSRIYDRCNLNSIMDKSTFEAITAVEKDYSIDSGRVYIYGSCVGGLLAFTLASRHPGVFAAVGAKGPELSCTNPQNSYDHYPAAWLEKNNILHSTRNFSTTSTYIVHSQKDEKARYSYSKILVDSIHRSGGMAILEALPDASKTKDFDLYPTAEITEKMFRFFSSHRLSPTRVTGVDTSGTAHAHATGPMSDIFSAGFLVVEGTCGTRDENIANKESAKIISESWENMYHTTCRIKKDIAVTKGDIQAFNLILLGSPASNIITKKIISRLPFSISKDSVTVGGTVIRGNDLEYTLLQPNPLQQEKYVLLAGCNNAVTPLAAFDLPYTGWYDYDVYSLGGRLHEKGLFHQN